jgi:inorganic pyrophosphatase
MPQIEVGDEVLVEIEVPRLGFVKPRARGGIDFVSPLPCPYNYGSVVGTKASDGDPIDALIMGARLRRGTRVRARVVAVMGFVDAGDDDPKLVCSDAPLTPRERAGIERFFRVYAVAKRALSAVRGRHGSTRCLGWVR